MSTIQRSEKYLKDMFFLSKANARHIVSIIQKSEEQRSEENNTRAFQVTFMQRQLYRGVKKVTRNEFKLYKLSYITTSCL